MIKFILAIYIEIWKLKTKLLNKQELKLEKQLEAAEKERQMLIEESKKLHSEESRLEKELASRMETIRKLKEEQDNKTEQS